jgi:hypothetical protein
VCVLEFRNHLCTHIPCDDRLSGFYFSIFLYENALCLYFHLYSLLKDVSKTAAMLWRYARQIAFHYELHATRNEEFKIRDETKKKKKCIKESVSISLAHT